MWRACLSPITETTPELFRRKHCPYDLCFYFRKSKPEQDPGRARPKPNITPGHGGPRAMQTPPLIFVILLSCSRGDALGIDARLSRSLRGLGFQAAVEVEVWTADREFRRWDSLLNKPQTCAPLLLLPKSSLHTLFIT